MKIKSVTVLFVLLLIVCIANLSMAAGTLDDAKAMVEKAAKFYQENGKEKAIQEFNNPKGQFVNGDLYIFAWDLKATVLAHPINPKQVGLNEIDLPDVNGKYYRKEAVEKVLANGTAIVEYKFKNPTTNKVGDKVTYFQKVGDIIVGCGAYK